MRIAQASTSRVLIGALLAVLPVLHTGCGAQSTERHGGEEIPDLSAGNAGSATSPEAGSNGGGEGGAGSSAPVSWCAAYKIVSCVCQQCHQSPPVNGAPIPLMTYEDTQAPFPLATSTNRVWQSMERAVASGEMPYIGDADVMPPVTPLSDEHRNTLLTWLAEGAHPLGGTTCPATCDWSKGAPTADF